MALPKSSPSMQSDDALLNSLFWDSGDGGDDNAGFCLPSRESNVASKKTLRPRAGRACSFCHARKVRCDAVQKRSTCTNCRLDGLTCVLRERRGSCARSLRLDGLSHSAAISTHVLSDTELPPDSILETPEPALPSIDENDKNFLTMPLTSPQDIISDTSMIMYSYFDFLNRESFSHMAPDDFKILELKGCFHIPSRPYLNQFIQQYFLHVHPILPVLNERKFWAIYLPCSKKSGQIPGDQVSLLVLRAMLFFVPAETIIALGFTDFLEARTSLYRQAKLLHNLNTKFEPIATAQSALLLSYYQSDCEPVVNTSWLRVSIQYAMVEKAHMYEQMRGSWSSEDYLYRKRLWWSIILRDRVLALGARRPMQVTHELFDATQDALCEEDLDSEFSYSCVYTPSLKLALARILIRQVNLAVVLTKVIALIYPLENNHDSKELDKTTTRDLPSRLQECRQELKEWFKQSESIAHDTTQNSSNLFKRLSYIYYHSARAALCQFECLKQFGRKVIAPDAIPTRLREIGLELSSAMVCISDTVKELVDLNMAQYLPVSVVAYIALPIVLDMISQWTNSSIVESGNERHQYLHFLIKLFSARYGTPQLEGMINRGVLSLKDDHQHAVTQQKSLRGFEGWFQVFLSQPRQYLYNVLALDIILSTGRFPASDEVSRKLLLPQGVLTTALPREDVTRDRFLPRFQTSPVLASTARDRLCLTHIESGIEGQNKVDVSDWDMFTFEQILDSFLESGIPM